MINSSTQNREDDLDQRLAAEQATIECLREKLKAEFERYGFAELAKAVDDPLVNPELRKDSFDGNQSLYAEWRTPSGALLGYLLIHGTGQSYAQFDVLKPHPSKPQWVIEAFTAWGSGTDIKAEPQLLPALGE